SLRRDTISSGSAVSIHRADIVYGSLKIAAGLYKGFLASHHSHLHPLSQLHHHGGGNLRHLFLLYRSFVTDSLYPGNSNPCRIRRHTQDKTGNIREMSAGEPWRGDRGDVSDARTG